MPPFTRRDVLGSLSAAGVVSATPAWAQLARPEGPWTLWYAQPARRWLDALPIGNGRLGAMIFGGPDKEILALNEATVWSGSPNAGNVNPSARQHLGQIRQLMFDGKYAEANALARTHLMGREESYGTHLPMAHLLINRAAAAPGGYRRSLDLETGLGRVEHETGGIQHRSEYFASNPDGVMVVRIAADRPGQVSLDVGLDPKDLPGEVLLRDPTTLILSGNAWEKRHSAGSTGVGFQVAVRLVAEGGRVTSSGAVLKVENADAVVLLIAANTNYAGGDFHALCDRQLAAAQARGFDALRRRHVADHGRLFRRVDMDLGGADRSGTPTDVRLAALRTGADDPGLSAIFFQYGRYLMIAGSRENSPLPMNLQGIWNDNLAANMVWTCDFHLDINTQQNYWPTNVCNLGECGEPLFTLVESLSRHGARTARDMYGAAGWVAHVYTDAWGFTAPGRGLGWGLFVTGGIWAASHLWEHYLFTRDRTFLARRAWPVLRGAAEFFLDHLVEHPGHKWLVTGPSISPENTFLSPEANQRCALSMGPTCDMALVAGLFDSVIAASRTLGVDAAFRARVAAARAKLPPLQIGKNGQLQEWLEDFAEAVPNHRHTSHCVALYPLGQITPEKTPALARAVRVSIDRRLAAPNWEDVEWSRANLINYYARLQDGNVAHRHVLGLMKEDSDNNLMTFSRAGIAGAADNIFAIDGNTAGTAGIAEMLLQSHDDIHLLPALPSAWPRGSVSGLRARGGFEVDLRWNEGRLVSAGVKNLSGGRCRLRYDGRAITLDIKPGASVRLDGRLQILT